jgi:hypothetical protein
MLMRKVGETVVLIDRATGERVGVIRVSRVTGGGAKAYVKLGLEMDPRVGIHRADADGVIPGHVKGVSP